MKFVGDQDLKQNQFENLIVHNGPTASFPVSPEIGQLYFDTDVQKLYVYRSTGWYDLFQPLGTLDSGIIMMWTGTIGSIPSGWSVCDGTGGTPDLMDKFVRCVPNDSTDPVLTPAGSATHSHTGYSHTHNVDLTGATVLADQATTGGAIGDGSNPRYPASPSHTHSLPSSFTLLSGSGASANSNDPTYYKLIFIRKT